MLGRTTVADDAIIIALLTDAPPTSKWCGIDVKSGSMLLYGPGTEHAAITPAGLSFSFASIPVHILQESAEHRGIEFSIPERGRVNELNPTSDVASVARLLQKIGHPVQEDQAMRTRDDIVLATGTLLAGGYRVVREPGRRVLDSRVIVNTCVDHVETIWDQSLSAGALRTPSVTELCSVAFVSERRLRNAFYDTFGVAPLRYFRLRSMTRARVEICRGNGSSQTVHRVAHDLGYDHLSRFASYYKDIFGESPSTTFASK
jgi:AraC-like DNA-binding protein